MNLTSDLFNALLTWLDPEPEAACQKYETLRTGLVRIFVSRGFSDAEDLTDLTIDRVTTRLPEIRDSYVGAPAKYFYGVARKIVLEARRRKEILTAPPKERSSPTVRASDHHHCLLQCLQSLPPEKREMILDYHVYDYEEGKKIEHHKTMAIEYGISESTLRLRAYRLRVILEKCVLECVERIRMKQNPTQSALSSERVDGGELSRGSER